MTLPQSGGRDRGSGTLAMVVLTPVLIVLFLGVIQIAMWTNTRSELRAIANAYAVQVARQGQSIETVEQRIGVTLDGYDHLAIAAEDGYSIRFESFPGSGGSDLVVVEINAEARAMFRGLEATINVRESVPLERLRD